MGLAIKNNQLKGVLNNGKEWVVKLSISPSGVFGVFFLNAKILINDVYQTTHVVSYEGGKHCKGEYRKALKIILIDCEKWLGVEILSSDLKVAV